MLSPAPVWEPSATKGVIEDGVRRQASLAELIGLRRCLVRIEIDPARVRLLGPFAFRDALCIPPDMHQRLLAAGLEMGANPADWSAVAGSVPLTAFHRIEFTVETAPYTGSRVRASGCGLPKTIAPIHPQPTNSP